MTSHDTRVREITSLRDGGRLSDNVRGEEDIVSEVSGITAGRRVVILDDAKRGSEVAVQIPQRGSGAFSTLRSVVT